MEEVRDDPGVCHLGMIARDVLGGTGLTDCLDDEAGGSERLANQPASVRRAYVIVNGRCRTLTSSGADPKVQVSVTGPSKK